MSFGLVMAGVGVASALYGASSSNKQAKREHEASKRQSRLDKEALKINTADAMKNQYKQFDVFLESQSMVVGSQTAFLEATHVDKRSSLYQDIMSKQTSDFHDAETQLQDNIDVLERNEKLGLQGIKINTDVNSTTYQAQTAKNYMNGLSNTMSSLYFGYEHSDWMKGTLG